jgi:glucuronoarabinoxylan endo-1,4-beta-xylanase
MKFSRIAFTATLLAMTSQAHALCEIGDTQECIIKGKPGIQQCNPHSHRFGLCQPEVVAPVATVTINWNDIHQTIDGFGMAQTGANCADPDWRKRGYACYLYNWPEPRRSQIMDLAFSQANGIGLTILRSEITPEIAPSKGVWNYTDTAQVWIMREAVKRGATKIFASVFSPPAWMKTNGQVNNCKLILDDKGNPILDAQGDPEKGCCLDNNGIPILDDKGDPVTHCPKGALKPENYQDFADLLSHHAGEYARANGVNIYAVSMTNEPNNSEAWRSCEWTPAQIATFLGDYLSPTFAANRIAAKVIAPETSSWDLEESYMNETYNNPTAALRLDIAAAHLYGGDPSLVFQNALTHGKKIWETEASLSNPVWDINGALSWATTIHRSLTEAQVNAWVWWTLAMWRGSDEDLMGLDDASTGAFSVSKTFWALGNFSKFIRPGFVRIGTTTTTLPPSADLYLHTSAYKDPTTGQFVIVAINSGMSDIDVSFRTGTSGYVTPYVTSATQDLAPQPAVSFASPLKIPAQSIVSYVGPQANVSLHKPDGMILSTGNIYFTSHDALGAHVFRTAQTSSPGEEIEI